jgi:hypothetical protein
VHYSCNKNMFEKEIQPEGEKAEMEVADNRMLIAQQAIQSEGKFSKLEKEMRQKISKLYDEVRAAEKTLENAETKQNITRSDFASRLPGLELVYPNPETIQAWADNGFRWPRIFGGDVPKIVRDSFIKGEEYFDPENTYWPGTKHGGMPTHNSFGVVREGDKLQLIKFKLPDEDAESKIAQKLGVENLPPFLGGRRARGAGHRTKEKQLGFLASMIRSLQ